VSTDSDDPGGIGVIYSVLAGCDGGQRLDSSAFRVAMTG